MTDDAPSRSFAFLGWPDDEPTLRLDYQRFSYAGKFVMTSTGKAVVRGPEHDMDDSRPDAGEYDRDVVAAVAFNEDRTDAETVWLRYVTVREDRRGEGLGPALVEYVVDRAREAGYDRARIAVNNAYSYEALYRAGFGYTGRETGIAELVLEHPVPTGSDREVHVAAYREGLTVFADRDDLSAAERAFIAEKRERGPPR
ncbi:GNAT family N-acetyltransferase [Haloarchaeobius sp. TZWSO28]|uniref:GNAT family N-acetyltransferase n=1 Tax=Haloarchaeobius sp. TZWSO28 TaxID=3446119 RepID=UPI003EBD1242